MKSTYDKYVFRTFAIVLLSIPTLSFSQEERKLSPVSRTYAITGLTIVQAPGRKVEQGTIVIKDGLINRVGKNLPIPPDAIVIKADSMFAYAGFIDGLSHTGVVRAKEESVKEKIKDPANPPADRAGITPQNDVRNFLSLSDKSLEEMRALGFTTAHVVPYGGMLPGSGAIISLGGNSADNMVVVSRSALYSELANADRIYPSTIMAVMAKWRELYTQAGSAKSYEQVYASNRNGVEKPSSDRILEAFYPVIDKRMPVLFRSEKILETQRILGLQSDLGFPLILGEIKEGWDIIPKIKSSGAKVFLSLELPEEKKDDKKDSKEIKPVEKVNPADSIERAALEKRIADFTALYVSQASAFQKAGVVFGFSTLTAKAKDIALNLRRMIKAGLTEDQALAALTTSPAQLLGLSDRLGSIDNGKVANLVISDKAYFSDKAKVRYVFVEGMLYKIEVKDDKSTAEKKTDKP